MSCFVLTQPAIRLTAKKRENKKALSAQKIPFTSLYDPYLRGTFLSFDALFPGTDIPVAVMLPQKASAYKGKLLLMPKGQNGLGFYNRINAALIALFGKPDDATPDASTCHWILPDHTLTHSVSQLTNGAFLEIIAVDFNKNRHTQRSDRYEKLEALFAFTKTHLPDALLHSLSYTEENGFPAMALDAETSGRGFFIMSRGGSLFASRYVVFNAFDPNGRPCSARQVDEASRAVFPCRSTDELFAALGSYWNDNR